MITGRVSVDTQSLMEAIDYIAQLHRRIKAHADEGDWVEVYASLTELECTVREARWISDLICLLLQRTRGKPPCP